LLYESIAALLTNNGVNIGAASKTHSSTTARATVVTPVIEAGQDANCMTMGVRNLGPFSAGAGVK
jgi:hypothetical protein